MVDEKEEGRVIWEGPAYLTNKIYVVFTGQMVRITFAEQAGPDEPPMFRTAVGLTPLDAIAFSKALANSLKPIEEAVAAQQQAAEK
jgi:hypothetical protein